jgi:eukaryotic-like serine/threonine-protein kinase
MPGAAWQLAAELRRRHVIRVTVAYCAVAWAVAQVSSTIIPALGIPEWGLSLVTVLLILGLPVTAVLAWAFDITPTGVQRTPAAPAVMRVDPAVPAVLTLPFVDRSATAEYQYLGDGIAEELINALAGLQRVRVVSRTSAFALRSAPLDLRELGTRFGVSHVVEGSVSVADDRIRVVVQLVGVRDGYALWSQSFVRPLENSFALQEEIARSLVAALQRALLPDAEGVAGTGVRRQPAPIDFEAYSSYLRGRQQWNERTPASLRRALQHFADALRRDPQYALAHAGVADCWGILVDHGIVAPVDGLPRAEAAAATALRLCPQLAEAHTSRALVLQLRWRFAEAEHEFRRALTLNPAYSAARQRLALLLAWLGRSDEARTEIRRGLLADPLSPVIATTQAWIEYFARAPEAAIDTAQRLLNEQPDAAMARIPLAFALLEAGRPDEAAAAIGEPEVEERSAPLLGVIGCVLGRTGQREAAGRLLEELTTRTGSGYVPAYAVAQVRLGLGDEAGALASLDQSFHGREPQLVCAAADPLFDPLRRSRRFRHIVTQVLPSA